MAQHDKASAIPTVVTRTSPVTVKKSTKIFVGRLPTSCKRSDLETLFSRYGVVKECDILSNYGFVHMETPEDAEAAIKGLNNYELNGTRITVEESTSRPRTKPGSRSRGNGAGSSRGDGFASGGRARRPYVRNGFGSKQKYYSAASSYWDRYGGRLRPYGDPYADSYPDHYNDHYSDHYPDHYGDSYADSYADHYSDPYNDMTYGESYNDRRYVPSVLPTTGYGQFGGYNEYYDRRTPPSVSVAPIDSTSSSVSGASAVPYSRYSYDSVYNQYDPYGGPPSWSNFSGTRPSPPLPRRTY